MKSGCREFNNRRGWMSFYAFMIAVVLAFYIAGTQVSSIDQNHAYRLRVFEAQSIQAADSALAFALRHTATHGGSWIAMEDPPAVVPRADSTAVWTGTEMIVWGGVDAAGLGTQNGGRYNPNTNSWSIATSTGAPQARTGHTAIWDNVVNRMIVWGGASGTTYLNTGGRYNPSTNTWTDTLGTPPMARINHTAVWTGSLMVIWGGRRKAPAQQIDTGASYNPVTNSWAATSALGAPARRRNHAAIWDNVANLMIVWGGLDNSANPLGNGGIYNPADNTWLPMNNLNAPEARANCTAVWTGSEMIVWGGFNNGANPLGNGGIYNPASDSPSLEPWRQIKSLPDVPPRHANAAVWMDGVMAVWGGLTDPATTATSTGHALRPECGHWGLITETDAPTARRNCSSVWTDQYMIIWGGRDGAGNIVNNGKRWLPPASITPASLPKPEYEMQINSAQIAAASLTYQLSSYTPAIVTVTSTVLDRNGREVGGRSVKHCLDVERHRYNKGCWSKP